MAPKTTVLQIRLSEGEKRLIKESAKRAELSMAAWLRWVIFKANLRALAPPKPKKSK